MDNQVENFIALFGSAVNGGTTKLSDAEFNSILELAAAHNVFALIVEKLSDFDDFRNLPEYSFYLAEAMSQVAEQARRTEAFLSLYRQFLHQDFHPIVMKGIVCRSLYSEYRDHRPSCDEDILIKKEDYRKAEKILNDCGYFPVRDDVTEENLDRFQEVSFFSDKSRLKIEMHINPMGNENEIRSKMNDCFKNVFDDYCEINIDSVPLRTMNHTDSYIYLVLHAFRHFTAGGFGFRQAVDIMLYEQKYGESFNWEYIAETLDKFNALSFLSDIIYIGNKYMKFNLPEISEPVCPDDLLEDLAFNGVFGNSTQAQRTAFQMTDAAVAGKGGKTSGASTMIRTAFPSKNQMLADNPELQEKPWLLPIKWAERWGRFIRHSKDSEGNLAKESMEIGKRRIKLLKKYGIV